ncbi:MAG: hypothetical protein IPK20_16460 [Betaproteobacteria bacterium]|nr:hypothetical protein [Betaproteobacteria bacterium]
MNFAAWIFTGLVVGWIANRLLNDGSREGRLGFLGFGVAGAIIGVQMMAPATEPGVIPPDGLNMSLLFYSACGAALTLFVGNFVKERFIS